MIREILKSWKKFSLLSEYRYVNLSDFKPKDAFSPSIWDRHGETKPKLNSKVKKALIKIAKDFISELKIKEDSIIDITVTGSLANYNWTKFSDIDLHIIVDFKKIQENVSLVKEYLALKSRLWNLKHEIKIKKYDVEIYVQDLREVHHSTGVYSILGNKWVQTPTKSKPSIDYKKIDLKVSQFADMIDTVEHEFYKKDYKKALTLASKVRKKLKKFRSAGLKKEGEFSSENLAFKTLRRNGYLTKLSDFSKKSEDSLYSVIAGKRDYEKSRFRGMNESIEKENYLGAGVFGIDPQSKQVLLGKRSKTVTDPSVWAIIGGGRKKGETPIDTAKREFIEETGYKGGFYDFEMLKSQESKQKPLKYAVYICYLDYFKPRTNDETEKFQWYKIDELSDVDPAHFGLTEILNDDKCIGKMENYVKKRF
jgi:8-oxo-dGTP pyrophosphatase MutT (NUDIX family)/predicted nucleotidyltransferase